MCFNDCKRVDNSRDPLHACEKVIICTGIIGICRTYLNIGKRTCWKFLQLSLFQKCVTAGVQPMPKHSMNRLSALADDYIIPDRHDQYSMPSAELT